jgi:hypothetical protein
MRRDGKMKRYLTIAALILGILILMLGCASDKPGDKEVKKSDSLIETHQKTTPPEDTASAEPKQPSDTLIDTHQKTEEEATEAGE